LTVEDLSLHILDVAENSVDAGATLVEITVREDTLNDLLGMEIKDNGRGMGEELIRTAADPFFTTKTVRKVGLGLPFLKQAAEECEGSFSIASEKNRGTTVSASFRRSHIDRKPLGDIGATIMVLIAGNPGIDFLFTYDKDGNIYRLDTREIKGELEEIPINSPEVLKLIRDDIDKGLKG
jgi:anti-sigma regulatory factor (Ser/Thr protein kinase)